MLTINQKKTNTLAYSAHFLFYSFNKIVEKLKSTKQIIQILLILLSVLFFQQMTFFRVCILQLTIKSIIKLVDSYINTQFISLII